jgi:hypothetical protein
VIRRLALLLAATLGALSLSACTTFTDNDAAARVNDVTLTITEFNEMLESELVVTRLQVGGDTSDFPADQARSVLGAWVVFAAADAAGLFTAEAKAAARDTLSTSPQVGEQFAAASPSVQDLFILSTALDQLAQTGAVTEEQLRIAATDADVHVDSRYGAWDASLLSIVPLG